MRRQQREQKELHIPARLLEREGGIKLVDFEFPEFVRAPFQRNTWIVYDSPYVQPIDYAGERYLKVEFPPAPDFAVRFSLTDYAIRHKDLAALCAVAKVLTTAAFEIDVTGKRAQLFVPSADNVLRSMTAEAMLELISNTMMGATKDTVILHSIRIDGHIQND
jgi:hypothetical protein